MCDKNQQWERVKNHDHAADGVNHDCIAHLRYVADVGAPGYGKDYECTVCGRSYWGVGNSYTPHDEMEPEDNIMPISWVK